MRDKLFPISITMKVTFILTLLFFMAPISVYALSDSEQCSKLYSSEAVKDYATILFSCNKSAKAGNPRSQFYLGSMYQLGLGVVIDLKLAFYWIQQSANQDDPSAQECLGTMYYQGQFVQQDYQKAFTWYKKAAELGAADAQYKLGLMYEKGEGVTLDYRKAIKWYKMSVEPTRGAYAVHALVKLGDVYFDGTEVNQDYEKAAQWYEKAINECMDYIPVPPDFNYQVILTKLGWISYNSQDFKNAAKWFTKLAELGYAQGQNDLGILYATGKGVMQDYVQAHKWVNLASTQSVPGAQDNLMHLTSQMTPAQLAEAQKLASEWKPKKQFSFFAM
jgi:TPR repeat protein